MSKPNHLPDFDLDDLAAHVSRGQYRRWDTPSEVPEELQDWASYSSTDEFRGLSLCASSTSHNPPRLGGVNVPSGATVYWIRTVRYDADAGEPHLNADDRFIFKSSNGESFQVTRHDHPDL